MKVDSRMDIKHNGQNKVVIQFRDLDTGDVFRLVDERQLYMVIQMPSHVAIRAQGVNLSNGERRVFSKHTTCAQVKMVCSWVDIKP